MRVLLAGATGAIGRPLARALLEHGHTVSGLTRDPAKAEALMAAGVDPVVADALDGPRLLEATGGLRVEAVIHQMTSLRTPPARHQGMTRTNELRTSGTRHLLEVARRAGATRFLTQSIVFGYGYTDHGSTPLTEESAFGEPGSGAADPHVAAMRTNEDLVIRAVDLEGMALRYGLFYGADDGMGELLRGRKVPVPRASEHTLAWVHLDDAVSATVAALEHGRGGQAYNIVDDRAVSWTEAITAMAEAHGAPAPRRVPDRLIRLAAPYVAAVLNTSLRVSHDKAGRELGWAPTYPTVHDGLRVAQRG